MAPAGTVEDVSTEPRPAPTDPEAFDVWAREAVDSWQRSTVHREVERLWADPASTVHQRALAAVWGAPLGPASEAEMAELLRDDSLDPVIRARLQAALASVEITADPPEAVRLVEEALAAMSDPSVPIRTRLGVWLTASEVNVRANRPAEAMRVLQDAGEAIKADEETPMWAYLAIDAERLAILAGTGNRLDQVVASAEKVAQAALKLQPTPTVLDVAVKMGGLLAGVGASDLAERYITPVVKVTTGQPEARGVRFQALLVLADVLFTTGKVDEALAAQRDAIATVEPGGDSPMLGWAHRGAAMQLRSAERYQESAEAFATAAEVYDRIDRPYDAAALRLEQATSLLHGDDPEAARQITEAVETASEGLPEERRDAIEMRIHQVLAHIATYQHELEVAAEHWLEVADRATKVGISPMEAVLAAAQLFAADDDIDEANAQFVRAELLAADAKDPSQATAMVMRVRAEALRDAGHAQDAAELARVAANHARTSGDEAQAIYLSVIAADSLHAAGDSASATDLYDDTLEAAEAASMPSLKGAVHAGYAKVLRELGRAEEAAEHERAADRLGGGRPAGES